LNVDVAPRRLDTWTPARPANQAKEADVLLALEPLHELIDLGIGAKELIGTARRRGNLERYQLIRLDAEHISIDDCLSHGTDQFSEIAIPLSGEPGLDASRLSRILDDRLRQGR
jgi:hypothetical protein